MDLPFSAYKGDQPYVFVCYAHEDKHLVYPQIRWLHEQGINVWYDEGVPPGEEWTEELGRAIECAERFIYFVTPASVASRNCRNEVHFAQKHGKALLAVHLKDTQLPSGLELTIGTSQAILKSQLTEDAFRGKLLATLRTPGRSTASSAVTRRRGPVRHIVAVVAVLIVVAGGGWYWLTRGDAPKAPVFDRSVMVKPFAADDPTLVTYADGLRNEVNGLLAGYPELRTVADAGRQTGSPRANYVVEGNVEAAGTGHAIRVQLVRTADNETVWSERFESAVPRGVAGVPALPTTIARFVRLQLVQDDQCLSIRRKTAIVEAADAVCAAMIENYRMNQGGAWDPELQLALAERAIALDPGLAAAYVYQGNGLTSLNLYGNRIPRDEALRRAGEAFDRAFTIERSPMALSFRGFFETYRLDYGSAEADFREAIQLDPLHPNARWFHAGLGAIAMRRGNVSEAVEHYRRATKIYDADARIYMEYSQALLLSDDAKSAVAVANKGLELMTSASGIIHLILLRDLTQA